MDVSPLIAANIECTRSPGGSASLMKPPVLRFAVVGLVFPILSVGKAPEYELPRVAVSNVSPESSCQWSRNPRHCPLGQCRGPAARAHRDHTDVHGPDSHGRFGLGLI